LRVAIIPAKGNSKRIPNKNRRVFHGRPIIAYSIDVAKASGVFNEVYVSTEDKEMAAIARYHGAKVIDRPKDLTKDSVGTQEVTKHAIEHLDLSGDDLVCCLYATAPLLAPIDLQQAYGMLLYRPCSYVVAIGTEPVRDIGNFYVGFASRFFQDLPLWNTHTGVYPMPVNRAIDINTTRDWEIAEAMYESLHGKKVGHA
jgi:N-acylneuraminate cytidylyltransferase